MVAMRWNWVLAALGLAELPVYAAPGYDVVEKSLSDLNRDLTAGKVTSEELVQAYQARIAALNPSLHAVIALNPKAIDEARAADALRKSGAKLGPLAGIPILLKDNIESSDGTATTAGSLALKSNTTLRDSPVSANLKAAGAIILGKTNLSEWANIRSEHSISGWSAVGGQTRNPYVLDRSPCGSSSGSGAAAAASLAAAAIGTETDGSITCPASVNGLVGLKPTVGLVSRTRIVPISHSQDTAGPMARSVTDAAVILSALAGSDPKDAATVLADAHRADYTRFLKTTALAGVRVGVMRFSAGFHPETEIVFNKAIETLKALGAVPVEITEFPNKVDVGPAELFELITELKVDLNAYLATTDPRKVPARTLADVIAFDKSHRNEEMSYFQQELFDKSQDTGGLGDEKYQKAISDIRPASGPSGIDAMLKTNDVAVLIAPTLGPAWLIDSVLKDNFVGGSAGSVAAIAGYPHLSVPMGQVAGLPVGLSFIGPAWSEGALLGYGYSFEQAAHARLPPQYLPTIEQPR